MVDAGEAGGTQRKQQMPPAKARKLLLRFPGDKNVANDNQQRTEEEQQCRRLAQDHDSDGGADERIDGLKRGAARGADLLHPRIGKKSNRNLKKSNDGKQQDALP